MHELSIALSLIDAACEKALLMGNPRVEALHVRIGPLSGVVPEALEFSFMVARDGTAISGARLQIERTELVARCVRCDKDRTLESPQHLRCPVCNESTPDVVSGYELEFSAMEVDEGVATNS